MEDIERSGNIIIMCSDIYMDDFLIDYTDDFYVGSYSDKEETLNRLQDALLVLKTSDFSFPTFRSELIQINVHLLSNGIWKFIFDSPISQKITIHILSRIIDLLKENNVNLNFFYPES